MNIKNKINLFIKKKIKEKKIKKKIIANSDLFENSIFDSLDYTQLVSLIESVGYQFNIKKNDYRIPRNINEINKILSKKKVNIKKQRSKIKKDNSDILIHNFKKKFRIKGNENLVIHSNFSNLIKSNISPKIFLEKLYKNFPNITIYTPAGFFRNKSVPGNSKIKMKPTNEFGLLTNELLKLKTRSTFRNKNPFDNLIGFNKKEKYFENDDYSLAYGNKSPYRKLLKKKTLIILLDVTFFYLSMFHMVELDAKVPYRKIKKFNFNGKIYNLFARDPKGIFLDYNKFSHQKKIKKLLKIINLDKSKIICADYKSIYFESLNILKKKPNFLLSKK